MIAAEHCWLSPLPPGGASAIAQRTADLVADGVVDRVVTGRPNAADEPEAFCTRMGQVLCEELAALLREDPDKLRSRRQERYRRLGLS